MGMTEKELISKLVSEIKNTGNLYVDEYKDEVVEAGFHKRLYDALVDNADKGSLPEYLKDYGSFTKQYIYDSQQLRAQSSNAHLAKSKTSSNVSPSDSVTRSNAHSAESVISSNVHSDESGISPNVSSLGGNAKGELSAVSQSKGPELAGDTSALIESEAQVAESSDAKQSLSTGFVKVLTTCAVVSALAYAGYMIYQNPAYTEPLLKIAQESSSSTLQSITDATRGAYASIQQITPSYQDTLNHLTKAVDALPDVAKPLSVNLNGAVQSISKTSIFQVLQRYWSGMSQVPTPTDPSSAASMHQDIQALLSSMQGITSSDPQVVNNIGNCTSEFIQANITELETLIQSNPSEIEFLSSVQTMFTEFLNRSSNNYGLISGVAVLGSGVGYLLGSLWFRSKKQPLERQDFEASPSGHGNVAGTQSPVIDDLTKEAFEKIQASAPGDPAISSPKTIFTLSNAALGTSVLALSTLALMTPQGQALSSGLIHSPIPAQLATSAKEYLSSGWQMVSGLFTPEMVKELVQFSDKVVPYVAPDSVWQKIGSIAPGLATVLGLSAVGYVASETLGPRDGDTEDDSKDPVSPDYRSDSNPSKAAQKQRSNQGRVLPGAQPDATPSKISQTQGLHKDPGDKPSVADESDVNQVVFVGEDESEIVRKQMDDLMQDLGLDADSFRYCVGGVDKDRNEKAYAVTCTRDASGDYFVPDVDEKEVLDAAKRDGFSAQQVQVSWKNAEGELDKDTQLPASYYAALTGLLEALESMPGKKIRIDGCEDMHFFRGICDAVCIHAKKGASSLDLMNRYVSNFSELNSQFKHEPNRMEQVNRLAKIKTYQASAQAQATDLDGKNSIGLNITGGSDIKGEEPQSNL